MTARDGRPDFCVATATCERTHPRGTPGVRRTRTIPSPAFRKRIPAAPVRWKAGTAASSVCFAALADHLIVLASTVVSETVYAGNAGADAPKGDQRSQWMAGEKRSALLLLVSGRFRVELLGRTVLLAEQGDYAVFHGLSHSWYAEEASVVVAVRWPSVPGYAAAQDGQDTSA